MRIDDVEWHQGADGKWRPAAVVNPATAGLLAEGPAQAALQFLGLPSMTRYSIRRAQARRERVRVEAEAPRGAQEGGIMAYKVDEMLREAREAQAAGDLEKARRLLYEAKALATQKGQDKLVTKAKGLQVKLALERLRKEAGQPAKGKGKKKAGRAKRAKPTPEPRGATPAEQDKQAARADNFDTQVKAAKKKAQEPKPKRPDRLGITVALLIRKGGTTVDEAVKAYGKADRAAGYERNEKEGNAELTFKSYARWLAMPLEGDSKEAKIRNGFARRYGVMEVRERDGRYRGKLPKGVKKPVISEELASQLAGSGVV